ncbi:MAG: hypothetical protein FWC34_00220 [Bacteroidetes bacterium]|nr:hypothetical protein [Bacteroidota bacterium]
MMSNTDYIMVFRQETLILYHFAKQQKKNQYTEIKHPLEASVKNKLERELDTNLSNEMIYIDSDTQWFLSTAMLLALTMRDNMHIRRNADKKGRTETDKVKINNAEDIEKVEVEQAEYYANGDIWTEPYEIIEIGGEKYRFTEKQKNLLIQGNIYWLEGWIERQKYILDEKKYLEHLCSVENLCKNNPFSRTKSPYEAMLYETVEGLRMRFGIL